MQEQGVLWVTGLRQPLGQRAKRTGLSAPRRAAQQAFDSMLHGDPFALTPENNSLTRVGRQHGNSGSRARAQTRGTTPSGPGSSSHSAGSSAGGLVADRAETSGAHGQGSPAEEAPPTHMDMQEEEAEMDLAEALAELWSEESSEEEEQSNTLAAAAPPDGVADAASGADGVVEGGANDRKTTPRQSTCSPRPSLRTSSPHKAMPSQQRALSKRCRLRPRRRSAGTGLGSGAPLAGYVYLDGRSVMRIQRNKPVGRCTVTCYRHPKCGALLNLDRTPSDADLLRWLFAMPAAPQGMPRDEAKEVAKEHSAMAKAKWSQRRQG